MALRPPWMNVLTPAQHLTAEPQLGRQRTEIETRITEGVEQSRVFRDQILRRLRQRRALGIVFFGLQIVETGRAHESAEILVVQRQLGDRLEGAADDAVVIIEIAIVDVGRAAAAAIGRRDEMAVGIFDTPELAVESVVSQLPFSSPCWKSTAWTLVAPPDASSAVTMAATARACRGFEVTGRPP